MKKLTLFFCFILIGFYSKAQNSKFDGRFLPVPGITIKQVWDTTATVGGYYKKVELDTLFKHNIKELIFPVSTTNYCHYHFLRNNTFGSPELMLLQGDTAGTSIQYGWYMLPSDIASIQGAITDSLGNPVTAGKVSLFRANSNFPQHDILASVSIDSTGTFQFDSIPFGSYRLAVKPDTSIYSTAIITYYGNKAKWKNAEVLLLSQDTSGINIELKYRKPLSGSGSIYGNISIDSSSSGKMKSSTSEPSEGTHIMLVDNVGSVIIDGDSNIDGDFTFENLADGDYELFVDVPGLEMSQPYSFSIVGNTIVSDLNFIIGEDSIYASSAAVVTRVNINSTILITNLSVFPNPCKEYTTLNVTLVQKDVIILEIFDALGNLIYTIAHEEHSSGQYSYKVSSKDLGENSGAFVVRLTTSEKCISQIIIKN